MHLISFNPGRLMLDPVASNANLLACVLSVATLAYLLLDGNDGWKGRLAAAARLVGTFATTFILWRITDVVSNDLLAGTAVARFLNRFGGAFPADLFPFPHVDVLRWGWGVEVALIAFSASIARNSYRAMSPTWLGKTRPSADLETVLGKFRFREEPSEQPATGANP
jgi:hypothetical protein